MGYIPQNALENLKKYSYKGVDRCAIAVIVHIHCLPCSRAAPLKVARLAIFPDAILELVRHALADMGRAQYRTSTSCAVWDAGYH